MFHLSVGSHYRLYHQHSTIVCCNHQPTATTIVNPGSPLQPHLNLQSMWPQPPDDYVPCECQSHYCLPHQHSFFDCCNHHPTATTIMDPGRPVYTPLFWQRLLSKMRSTSRNPLQPHLNLQSMWSQPPDDYVPFECRESLPSIPPTFNHRLCNHRHSFHHYRSSPRLLCVRMYAGMPGTFGRWPPDIYPAILL